MKRIRDYVSRIPDVALTVAILVLAGIVVKTRLISATPPLPATRFVQDSALTPLRSHSMGSASALVTVSVFSDYRCPYCANMQKRLDALFAGSSGSIRIVHRHFPLSSIHDEAFEASVLSECAAAQGEETFWRVHRSLLRRPALIRGREWGRVLSAATVVDTVSVLACLGSHGPQDALVVRDTLLASRLAISSTPTILIDNELLHTSHLPDFESRVEKAVVRRGGSPFAVTK